MEFWDFFDKNFVSVITLLSAISGAFVGGLITYKSQRSTVEKQIEWDKEKNLQEQHNTRLKAYNKALEADGSSDIVTPLGGTFMEFDIVQYQQKVRPLLYEEFHVLHQGVADIISKIDFLIQSANFEQELMDIHQVHHLAVEYGSLISLLNRYVKENRESFVHKKRIK